MERQIWREYAQNEVNEKIQYWVDVWDDLIDHFTKNEYGLELLNPHVLLLVLVDEIEQNELRNDDVRKYLVEGLGRSLKSDSTIKECLGAEFSLILSAVNGHPLFYLLQTCKAVLPFFQSGEYFRQTYRKLRASFSDSNWKPNEENDLLVLSNSLIVELLLKGYSLDSIRVMPKNILRKGNSLSSNFPTEKQWDDYADLPEAEQAKIAAEGAEEIKSLTLDKRLAAFPRYITRNPRQFIFIFEVEGVKGETELVFGPVTFYSPFIRSFIKGEEEHEDMWKQQERFNKSRDHYFINAAVSASAIDYKMGAVQAAEAIDKSLDLLRSRYKNQCRFEVVRDQVLVLRRDGKMRATFPLRSQDAFKSDRQTKLKWVEALDTQFLAGKDEDSFEAFANAAHFLFTAKEKQSEIERKITDCLHWFRKGEESERLEDRLLHYWIVLEKIFTFPSSAAPLVKSNSRPERKILLVSELLSATVAYWFIYGLGWTLHRYLWHLVHSSEGMEPLLKLPDDLIEKCFLQGDREGTVFLKDIIGQLKPLANVVDKRLVKARILHAERFYQDGNYAKEEIVRKIATAKDDILLIYRYRNSIVHNAHYDPSLLSPFVEKAGRLARTALGRLIVEHTKKPSMTVEEIFVARYVELQRILHRLEKNLPVDFLEVATWNKSPASPASAVTT